MALHKLLVFCTLPGICSWVLRFKTFVCTYDRCSWTNCESLRWTVFLESTKITRLFRTSFKDYWLLKTINCFCLERKIFSLPFTEKLSTVAPCELIETFIEFKVRVMMSGLLIKRSSCCGALETQQENICVWRNREIRREIEVEIFALSAGPTVCRNKQSRSLEL